MKKTVPARSSSSDHIPHNYKTIRAGSLSTEAVNNLVHEPLVTGLSQALTRADPGRSIAALKLHRQVRTRSRRIRAAAGCCCAAEKLSAEALTIISFYHRATAPDIDRGDDP